MAIKPILTVPDPILKQVSKPVAVVNDEIRALVADMLDSMYEAKGIGLAAIQIGVPLRVITMDLVWGKEDADGKPSEARLPQVFINPEILDKSENLAPYEEGCLSVPDYYDEIERPAKVKIKYLNEKGEEIIEDAEGLYATCIQHEMDHLNGVLFIDYLSRLRRERAVAKVKKGKKLNAA
jgi:peptide deformylase